MRNDLTQYIKVPYQTRVGDTVYMVITLWLMNVERLEESPIVPGMDLVSHQYHEDNYMHQFVFKHIHSNREGFTAMKLPERYRIIMLGGGASTHA